MRAFLLTLLGLTACDQNFDVQSGNDELEPVSLGSGTDGDDDGWGEALDCDDGDASVYPGADEVCANGVDDDCDGITDADGEDRGEYCYDADQDGYCQDYDGDGDIDHDDTVLLCDTADANAERIASQTGGDSSNIGNYILAEDSGPPDYENPDPDCDDDDASVSPGADEVCDLSGVDEDCDGYANADDPDDAVAASSTWYADVDVDDYGDPDSSTEACEQPTGYVADATDCDDGDAGVSPASTEACDDDDVDEDCDGAADDEDAEGASGTTEWYDDLDGDGAGAGSATESCDALDDQVESSDDCDDGDDTAYPGADETCADDGTDNDCDGDDGDDPSDPATWYADDDGDGYGDGGDYNSCVAPTGYVATDDDCDDDDASVNPGATDGYDGLDNDCDNEVDEGPCALEIQILAGGGDATSITGSSTDDASLDGEWFPSGVTGVTVTETNLGGSEREYFIEASLCVSEDGSVILDGAFEDGTSLADGEDNTFATMDGVDLTVALSDNGDGTYSYAVTR